MADGQAGALWYDLSYKDEQLRAGLKRAEDQLRASGRAGEDAFATPMERATGRVKEGVRGIVSEFNALRGRGPEQLTQQLERAAAEADEARDAVERLTRAGTFEGAPAEARKYADALNEIQLEADQTVADLRELQAADPRFDTPELQRAANELDRVGKEAGESAAQLNQMKGVRADTHLERVAQEANEAAVKLDDAGDKSEGLMGKLKGVKGVLAGLGLAIGAQQLLRFAGEASEAFVAVEQSGRTVQAVFGEASATIDAFTQNSARRFGISKQSAQEMGAVMGQMLQNLGFDSQGAAARVVTLQQRAADMAATFGGDVSDAVAAISSLLRGERNPVERYGVSIKQIDVNARIAALGLDVSTEATKKNAEAIAGLDLFMEQTATTAGRFVAEMDSLAGRQQVQQARNEEAAAWLGQQVANVQLGAYKIGQAVEETAGRWALQFGEMGAITQEAADRIGMNADQLRIRVAAEMWKTGADVDLAVRRVANGYTAMTEAQWAAVHESATAWEAYQDQITAGSEISEQSATDGARAIAAAMLTGQTTTRQALADLRALAVEEARMTPDEIATALAAGEISVEEAARLLGVAISGPVEDGTDDAVDAVESMYARIAAEIAARESQLRQAGGDAVQAWLDPQVWAQQLAAVNAEIESADAVLAEELRANAEAIAAAREKGDADALAAAQRQTDALKRDAATRKVELTAEAIELQQNLALTGTETEQAAALSSLRTSDFMLAGLSSKDEEIRALFQEWNKQLGVQVQEMERKADNSGRKIPGDLRRGIDMGTPAVHGSILRLTAVRPDTSWAYSSGYGLGSRFHAGMAAWVSAVKALSIELGANAAVGIRLRSPAKEGALSEDAAIWSQRLLDRWLEPLSAGLGDAAAVSRALGDAVAMGLQPSLSAAGAVQALGVAHEVPRLSALASAGAVPAAGTTHIERNIHLHAVQGYPILENADDTLRTLQQAQWFDEWSLSGG